MSKLYNRYIPQSDGSYSRRRIPDPRPTAVCPTPVPPAQSPPQAAPRTPPCHPRPERPPAEPVSTFLRKLLPRDFGTEDLIVVLLLILMAGSDPDKQNTALLTLALYLFL